MNTASSENELWSAIAVFERIVEVSPTDRQALETLSDAYLKLGDISRAHQYIHRLVEVLVQEGDAASARQLADRLRTMGHSEIIVTARKRLESLIASTPAPTEKSRAESGLGSRRSIDVTREVALAWDLLQAGLLVQEVYAHVVHDLTELSTQPKDSPVTALHTLLDLQFDDLEKVLAHLARTTRTPLISLAGYEMVRETFSILPMEMMLLRGAVAFERMGPDLLVAVMNPQDQSLREEVQRLARRTCHFYVAHPADFNVCIANVRKVLTSPM